MGNETIRKYGEGNGQIDAAINTIKEIMQRDYSLDNFNAVSKGKGSDAVGFTRLEISKNKWKVIGKSENTDIVKASIGAFIDGCNRLKYIENYFDARI